jgi:hypothetical protein
MISWESADEQKQEQILMDPERVSSINVPERDEGTIGNGMYHSMLLMKNLISRYC